MRNLLHIPSWPAHVKLHAYLHGAIVLVKLMAFAREYTLADIWGAL